MQQLLIDQENLKPTKQIFTKEKLFYKRIKGNDKIIIFDTLGKEIITKTHLFYGHIGSKHIQNKIQPFYYFPVMHKLIHNVCEQCEICIKNKTRQGRRYGFLSQLGPANAPFQIVSLDTIGGFGGNRSSKQYLHLLVDHFSRFVFIHTSKHQTADDFIKLIQKISSDHNINTLLTDQYSGINSTRFKNFLQQENIEIIFTAVDSAFSNGLNERLNQTLVNRIRCKINETKKKKTGMDENRRRMFKRIQYEFS